MANHIIRANVPTVNLLIACTLLSFNPNSNIILLCVLALRWAGERPCMPSRVQAAQCVHHPSDAELIHRLQHVQLARPAQAPTADAHLQHQDGRGQVLSKCMHFGFSLPRDNGLFLCPKSGIVLQMPSWSPPVCPVSGIDWQVRPPAGSERPGSLAGPSFNASLANLLVLRGKDVYSAETGQTDGWNFGKRSWLTGWNQWCNFLFFRLINPWQSRRRWRRRDAVVFRVRSENPQGS